MQGYSAFQVDGVEQRTLVDLFSHDAKHLVASHQRIHDLRDHLGLVRQTEPAQCSERFLYRELPHLDEALRLCLSQRAKRIQIHRPHLPVAGGRDAWPPLHPRWVEHEETSNILVSTAHLPCR